jgi:hypothetical protein
VTRTTAAHNIVRYEAPLTKAKLDGAIKLYPDTDLIGMSGAARRELRVDLADPNRPLSPHPAGGFIGYRFIDAAQVPDGELWLFRPIGRAS